MLDFGPPSARLPAETGRRAPSLVSGEPGFAVACPPQHPYRSGVRPTLADQADRARPGRAVFAGRLPLPALEDAAQVRRVPKAALGRHAFDGRIRLEQLPLRPLDPQPRN